MIIRFRSRESVRRANPTIRSYYRPDQVNAEFEEWLDRRLVCTTYELRDLVTLSSAIVDGFGQCTKVSALIPHTL